MKKLILFFCLGLIAFTTNGQLVISEISYNPPESGTDSLEYIEIYNATDATIDLTGYIVADNSSDTLTEGMIPSGGYVVLASFPAAINSVFGVDALATPNIALRNSGEKVSIFNPSGNLIDEVEFSDSGDWPTFEDGTDGAGASIELCNLEADNSNGANWRASTNDLGIMINDIAVFGTPAAANSATCEAAADYTIEVSSNVFTPAELTIQVGESVKWINTGGSHNVNGTQETYPDNPEGFFSGAPSSELWEYIHTFTVPGRYDYQCDMHVGVGMVGIINVEAEQGPELSLIGEINGVNAEGFPENIGQEVKVQGVVHGENLNPSGYQFSIVDVDNEEGIGIFSNINLGYQYAEGDLIEVTGVITFFNGLTQIEPTEVTFISADNPLMAPREVLILDESTESILVQLNGVEITDPSQWKGDGSSYNVEVSDGSNVYTLRIDNNSQLSEADAPEGIYDIIGIGGQFDSESPFLEGYQLFPRSLDDFIFSSSEDYRLNANISISPNPASSYINVSSDEQIESYSIYDLTGRLMRESTFEHTIKLYNLPAGTYLIKFLNGEKYDIKKLLVR